MCIINVMYCYINVVVELLRRHPFFFFLLNHFIMQVGGVSVASSDDDDGGDVGQAPISTLHNLKHQALSKLRRKFLPV